MIAASAALVTAGSIWFVPGGPIWFGILIVTIVEIGMISPPVGLNLFVLNSLLPDVKLSTLYRGIWPFVMADIVRLGILIAFPAIALWLPGFMNR